MCLVAHLPKVRIDERTGREGQPHLHLGAAVGVEREELMQHAGGRRERVGFRPQCGEPLRHPPHDEIHREVQQLSLAVEVVAEGPERPARLGGHAAQ